MRETEIHGSLGGNIGPGEQWFREQADGEALLWVEGESEVARPTKAVREVADGQEGNSGFRGQHRAQQGSQNIPERTQENRKKSNGEGVTQCPSEF